MADNFITRPFTGQSLPPDYLNFSDQSLRIRGLTILNNSAAIVSVYIGTQNPNLLNPDFVVQPFGELAVPAPNVQYITIIYTGSPVGGQVYIHYTTDIVAALTGTIPQAPEVVSPFYAAASLIGTTGTPIEIHNLVGVVMSGAPATQQIVEGQAIYITDFGITGLDFQRVVWALRCQNQTSLRSVGSFATGQGNYDHSFSNPPIIYQTDKTDHLGDFIDIQVNILNSYIPPLNFYAWAIGYCK